jgi:hypothetical protein
MSSSQIAHHLPSGIQVFLAHFVLFRTRNKANKCYDLHQNIKTTTQAEGSSTAV